MATTTFDDVLTFIRTAASDGDIDRFAKTASQRTTALNTMRAEALTVGRAVRLERYQDARLNGLTGTVEHIERHSGAVTYAAVRLDEASTERYRNFRHVPEGTKEHVVTRLHATGCFPA